MLLYVNILLYANKKRTSKILIIKLKQSRKNMTTILINVKTQNTKLYVT